MKKIAVPRLAWLLLFIVWIFFGLLTFYAVQKPFSAANVLAVGCSLLNLLVAGWLSLVGLALGSWLLRHLRPPGLLPAEVLFLGTGLGLGGLGLLSFMVGLAGLFSPWVAYGLLILLSGLLAPQAVRLARQWSAWRPANTPSRLAALYLGLVAVLTLLLALLPPTDWDGLFYHLAAPRLYLQAGGVVGGVDVPHFNFPALMEMLFAWAMLLRGDIAAKLLHTVFGLLLAGLVYLTGRRFFSRRAAWPGVLILASMPMVSTLAGWAYNDLALAFYQLAALYATVHYLAGRGGRWALVAGILAGLAMGLKYTSFVTPLVIVGLVGWRALRADFSRHGRGLALFVAAALLVALPWYVKNWVSTGNPVYPFLFGVFGGQYWDSFRADWYAAAGTGVGWRPSTLAALPWLLTLGVRDMNYWDGRTGPLLLLFLPLVLFYGLFRYGRDRRPAALDWLLVYALAQFGFWTLGVVWSRSLWQSRLLLPGLVALAPVVGWIWADLPRLDVPRLSLSRFVNITVALVLALTVVDMGLLAMKIDPLPYLVGLESRQQLLARRLGAYYGAMEQLNESLPPEAKVVFLWEPRSYYCRAECLPDSILERFPHLVHRYGSTEAIVRSWRQAGVSHVLVSYAGLEFVLNETPEVVDRAVLAELEKEHWRQLFEVGGAYRLYALEEGP